MLPNSTRWELVVQFITKYPSYEPLSLEIFTFSKYYDPNKSSFCTFTMNYFMKNELSKRNNGRKRRRDVYKKYGAGLPSTKQNISLVDKVCLSEAPELLKRRYLYNYTWEELAEFYEMPATTIRRIHDRLISSVETE